MFFILYAYRSDVVTGYNKDSTRKRLNYMLGAWVRLKVQQQNTVETDLYKIKNELWSDSEQASCIFKQAPTKHDTYTAAVSYINPTALSLVKTQRGFCHSEGNRVKVLQAFKIILLLAEPIWLVGKPDP